MKPREWWIISYNDGDTYFCHSPEERDCCLDTIEGATPTVHHVVEYSAYAKAVTLLKAIEDGEYDYYEKDHKDDGTFTPSYYDKIRDTLRELGELEEL